MSYCLNIEVYLRLLLDSDIGKKYDCLYYLLALKEHK